MNTLQAISLRNFQSFKEERVELSPTLTCVIGPSNLGKSALIRAIKALARNAPAPGLVREGEKELCVGAVFSDGTTELLEKGKKKSVYTVSYSDGNEIVHGTAGATSVPDEVAQLWALPDVDSRELVFTNQHEAPFLLDEPASAVAKVLGKLTNATALMVAVQDINKRRTAALNDEKARLREAEEAREELLTHRGLSARIKAVEAADEALSALQKVQSRHTNLVSLLRMYESLQEIKSGAEIVLNKSSVSTAALDKATQAVDELKRIETLAREFVVTRLSLDKAVESHNNAVLAKSSIETEIHDLLSSAGICPLCGNAVV